MKFKSIRRVIALTITGFLGASSALAEAPAQYVEHGFLTDYSLLEPFADSVADYRYVAPNAFKDLANYNAVMIDQPEIFISPNSKYKGVKPDNLKAIADFMRAAVSTRLTESGYHVVESPGADVLFLRIALADVELVKKKRGVMGYTPGGFIVQGTMQGMANDISKKVRLDYLTVEIEVLDSATGDVLIAGLISKGAEESTEKKKAEVVQWEVLEAYLQNVGKRIECRLSNAKLPENEWADCLAIKAELTQEIQKRKMF